MNKPKRKKPTQETLKGHEIPLPKRNAIMGAFRKIAKPVKRK